MSDRLSGEIIEPFIRAMDGRDDLAQIQIMGGNGSAALKHEDTEIDFSTEGISAPGECDLPRFREDGSLRDVDILGLTPDQAALDAIESVAREHIGEELIIEVFGTKDIARVVRQTQQPVRATAKAYVSDRYLAGDTEKGVKYIYPFATAIDDEFLSTFTLYTPDSVRGLPTTHPGATILNYLTRSISGLRPKDVEKITEVADNLLGKYPELLDWMIDGPGGETYKLARLLHTIRESKRNPQDLHVGEYLVVEPYPYDQLETHAAFLAAGMSPRARRLVLGAAHVKSRVIHKGESNKRIVKAWHEHIEPRIHDLIHNN